MPTIQEQFHAIGNWHNKITIAAGCTRELLRMKPLATLTSEELNAKQEEIVSVLRELEKNALAADEKVTELKHFIYEKLGPKTTFEITPESHKSKRGF